MKTNLILVFGGTGKTGRRVAQRLVDHGAPFRIGSRSADPSFDWENQDTWLRAIGGATAAYVTYYPDVALPGAAETLGSFSKMATDNGVQRLVFLSGRGEESAQRAERAVMDSGAEWTIVRSSFFCQNFSEGVFADALKGDEFCFPATDVREPFIDADDIADVAVAALTNGKHAGQIYEVTGPRLMTFAEAISTIATGAGRSIRYVPVSSAEYQRQLIAAGFPPEAAPPILELFATVLDGRNAHLGDGVQRALGRTPRAFEDYVRETADSGVWKG